MCVCLFSHANGAAEKATPCKERQTGRALAPAREMCEKLDMPTEKPARLLSKIAGISKVKPTGFQNEAEHVGGTGRSQDSL